MRVRRHFLFPGLAALALVGPSSSSADSTRQCDKVSRELCDVLNAQLADAQRARESASAANTDAESASGVQRVTQSADEVGLLQRALTACNSAVVVGTPIMVEAFWEQYGLAQHDATGRYRCTATPPPPPVAVAPPSVVEPDYGSPLLLDVDLGVPVGVRVGYTSDEYWGIGLRAGLGPALLSGSWYGAGVLAAFGEIPIGWQGIWRVEPSAGLAITGIGVGPLGGLDIHGSFAPDATFSAGFRAGLDVGVVSSSALIMPEGSFVLSW